MEKANLSKEPIGNWKSVEYFMPAHSTDSTRIGDSTISTDSNFASSLRRASLSNSIRSSIFSMNNNILKSLVKVSERPSELNSLHDVQINDYKKEISCFL